MIHDPRLKGKKRRRFRVNWASEDPDGSRQGGQGGIGGIAILKASVLAVLLRQQSLFAGLALRLNLFRLVCSGEEKKRNKIWNMGSSRSFYLLAKFPRLLAISPSVLLNFFLLLLLSYPEALPYGTLRSWSEGVISGSQKYREKLEWIVGSTQDTLSISSTRYTHICDI